MDNHDHGIAVQHELQVRVMEYHTKQQNVIPDYSDRYVEGH